MLKASKEDAVAPSRRVPSPRRRHTVVVVDDQSDMRDLIELVLDDEDDFDVVATAGDGAAAIRLVQDLRPDLVLMDLSMPVMSGLDALQRLRADHDMTRIVILSARPRDTVDPALAVLADDYLDKTIIVTDLVERLRAVCRRPPKPAAAAG
jgi:DNA-binding NarL/FixJ family response regulator